MNISEDIKTLLENPSQPIAREWLNEAMAKYPYFTLPLLMYLHRNKDSEGLDEDLLAKLAISSPDRKALFAILGDDAEKFASFYPAEQEPKQLDTDSTLDTFLANYGNTDEKEIELLNRMIFNPVPDYAQMLAAEEERSAPVAGSAQNEEDALINSFIIKQKDRPGYFPTEKSSEKEPAEEVDQNIPIEAPNVTDDSMLSESLAKIYIKQRKYAKALEIIKTISLKYPEKSIYFADQIRFLRKLVKTENIKNNK